MPPSIRYYIQKKIYDPKRVAIRSLRNNKCPHCKNKRYKDLSHCPSCGRKDVQESTEESK